MNFQKAGEKGPKQGTTGHGRTAPPRSPHRAPPPAPSLRDTFLEAAL